MELLSIADKTFSSRLIVGTGKYKDFDETRRATEHWIRVQEGLGLEVFNMLSTIGVITCR